MNTPEIQQSDLDYTEFDGKPVEWWRAYKRKHSVIPQHIPEDAKPVVAELFPDPQLQKHVARIARSAQDGHTTVLTTSGRLIQFQPAREAQEGKPAASALIVVSRDIDAAGVSLIMARYKSKGREFEPDQIPFADGVDQKFKDHVRGLWAELQEQQKQPRSPLELSVQDMRDMGSVHPMPARAATPRMARI